MRSIGNEFAGIRVPELLRSRAVPAFQCVLQIDHHQHDVFFDHGLRITRSPRDFCGRQFVDSAHQKRAAPRRRLAAQHRTHDLHALRRNHLPLGCDLFDRETLSTNHVGGGGSTDGQTAVFFDEKIMGGAIQICAGVLHIFRRRHRSEAQKRLLHNILGIGSTSAEFTFHVTAQFAPVPGIQQSQRTRAFRNGLVGRAT